jgi:tetratricopeptide (TPR) repeat protein
MALVVVAAGHPGAAADPWLEVKSPNFTVLSNGTDARARNIAWQFEQIRTAIQSGWPWSRTPLDRPLLIVAARNEATMKTLAPKYWEPGQLAVASVYGSSAARHYIALRADIEANDSNGANPYRYSYWAYSGLMLSSGLGSRLPLWFTTGFNEISSNTQVTTKTVQIGRPIRTHLTQLADRLPFPVARVLAITQQSPEYTQQQDRQAFEAESWGMMQYVLFGTPAAADGREARANQLARLLQNGTASAAAIEQVFGSVQAFEDGLKLFFRQGAFNYRETAVDASIDTKNFAVRPLSEADAAALRAGLHVALGRPVEARRELDTARAGSSKLAVGAEAEALLLDREGKADEARQAYAAAADLGSDAYYVQYRAATLAWRPNADAAAVDSIRRWLAKSIELNPRFAGAHSLLSNVLMQANQLEPALDAADKALGLDPRRAYYRMMRATILARLRRFDEALTEARVALAMSETDDDKRQAQSLVTSLERVAPAPATN